MLLLKLRILLLLLIAITFSCSKEDDSPFVIPQNDYKGSIDPRVDSLVIGIPLKVELTRINTPKAPKTVKIGQPRISKANINVFSIQSPDVKLVSEIIPTEIPGKNNVNLPKQTMIHGEVIKIILPKTTPALPPTTTDAAYYSLQFLDVDQGLSSSFVMDIIEDKRGNLWVSTWSTGVCMYNSQSFTNYTEKNGLTNNYIWTIFEDSKGNIWFGSDGGGVSVYNGDHFTNFMKKDGLAGNLVLKIIEDDRNNIWIATSEGLTKYNGTTFTTYTNNSGLLSNYITDIFLGENNRILIATDKGFSIFDGVVFSHYTENEGVLNNATTSIFEDSEGNIWIGTLNNGVCMYDGYTFFSFTTEQGLSDNAVLTIMEDDNNQIWIGTKNNGISIYNHTSFTIISRNEGLSSKTVRSIYQDSKKNIWIGTHGGLNKYNERSFKNYTEEQGLGGQIIKGICEDQFGNLWFGHSNGISKYTGQEYEHYTTQQGLSDNNIRAITQDHLGNLWIATENGGVTYYNHENFIQYTTENGLSSNFVICMYEDINNNMWFGTYGGGVTKFDGENFFHLTMKEGLSGNTVRAICEDEQNNIWIGTNISGLEKFDGKYITHHTIKNGLPANEILSLMYDSQGKLWIGTENSGLGILSNGKIFTINNKQGLSKGSIWSIIEDYEQNVWIGTENGLDLIEIKEKNDYNITNFGKLDGLKGTDFYPNSVCLDSENKIWWGTGKALAVLDLNKYERIKTAPTISITDVLIDQSNVNYRDLQKNNNSSISSNNLDNKKFEKVKFDHITPFTNFPENIELPYNLNHITIHFSANDWTAPHKIKYMHKLEGASNEWHTLTNDNKVVHSYLPEGKYVFHLKAIGEANIWSETLLFNITIHPPWWRAVWAYLIYFLIAILIISFLIIWRTKKLIQQRKLLENLVTQRTIEVVKQKELVESKNKEIIDSITYAKRLQRAILPSSRMIKRKLKNAFILFKPKDIVAGDFYWLEEKNDKILLACADCTGHGVPGAMVSLVCNNALNRSVREFSNTDPALILNKVRDIVIESFTNSYEEVKDGMDIALIALDIKTKKIRFSGANNNIIIISDNEISIFRGDRQPIGKYLTSRAFNSEEIQLKTGDIIYMYTDGFSDQFGGEKGKKMKSKLFLETLLKVHTLKMSEQKEFLLDYFNQWMGDHEQVDDVSIIGLKIV